MSAYLGVGPGVRSGRSDIAAMKRQAPRKTSERRSRVLTGEASITNAPSRECRRSLNTRLPRPHITEGPPGWDDRDQARSSARGGTATGLDKPSAAQWHIVLADLLEEHAPIQPCLADASRDRRATGERPRAGPQHRARRPARLGKGQRARTSAADDDVDKARERQLSTHTARRRSRARMRTNTSSSAKDTLAIHQQDERGTAREGSRHMRVIDSGRCRSRLSIRAGRSSARKRDRTIPKNGCGGFALPSPSRSDTAACALAASASNSRICSLRHALARCSGAKCRGRVDG